MPEWNRRTWSSQPCMVLVLCLRAIFAPIRLRVTTGPQESGLMMSMMRFLTTPMLRVTLVATAVRSNADASRHAGGNSCRQNDRNTEARERAIMKALDLIEDSNEILQLADGHPGVRLVGQSKEEARRLLNNVKACRMEF